MRQVIAVVGSALFAVGFQILPDSSAWAVMPPGAPGPATAGFTLVVNEPAEAQPRSAYIAAT